MIKYGDLQKHSNGDLWEHNSSIVFSNCLSSLYWLWLAAFLCTAPVAICQVSYRLGSISDHLNGKGSYQIILMVGNHLRLPMWGIRLNCVCLKEERGEVHAVSSSTSSILLQCWLHLCVLVQFVCVDSICLYYIIKLLYSTKIPSYPVRRCSMKTKKNITINSR